MSRDRCPFTPRQAQAVALLAQGLTAHEVAGQLGIKNATKLLTDARKNAGVTTNRALVYVTLSRQWLPLPDTGPAARPEGDGLEELVWAGLRYDVLDNHLPGVIAAIARTTPQQVRGILNTLKEQHQLTHCGLLTRGFALGLLSGREGTQPPPQPRSAPAAPLRAAVPRSGPARTGPWKLTGRQNKALSLLPESGSIADAAASMGVSTSSYRNHLKTISGIANVCCLRALTHRALQDGLLRAPSPSPAQLELSPDVLTVWRSLVLDVPDSRLPPAIRNHTGLSINTVHGNLRRLRVRYGSDEAAICAGWTLGVITADTPTLPADRTPPPPLPAPAPRATPRAAPVAMAPMTLSPRQHQVLTLRTVKGMSRTEAADHLQVRPHSVREYENSCLRRAEATTLRTLTHRALSDNLLDPLEAGDRDPGPVPGDAEAVWRCLPMDVPEAQLAEQTARMTGLRQARVQECLDLLRATGLTDPQLVAAGWHRKLLTTHSTPTPPAAAPEITSCRIVMNLPAAGPLPDPLRLLPGPPPAPRGDTPPWGTSAVTGRELDFVRISASTCRTFLARIPATRWGPVIGLPDVRSALLLTTAEPRPARRGQGARLIRPGAVVALPPPGARTGPGRYWAIGPQAPLWEQRDLAWLLEHSTRPMPALTGEAPR
ncbi:hypothetical protein [Streptomyces sp. CFMR 7]|uniref:hypothetical protein n=1 Tax=Streptomyces sp. CFMR 7 TaxID=1649184 RepID=UPI00119E1B4D|nr:hypothetical protein [Streptomyces sp. CFMR 7]